MTNQLNRPKYSLATAPTHSSKDDLYGRKAHRRRGSDDVENGSLSYSAASSVNSAGESTDSSFGDIMRVLDVQDTQELKGYMRKEGVSSVAELKSRRGLVSQPSVASSLAYSTDGESNLEGTKILQTITGQPSDGHGYDGASYGEKDEPFRGDSGLLFAPAEPGRIKKKKKSRETRDPRSSTGTPTSETEHPASFDSTPSKGSSHSYHDSSPSPSVDTPTKSPPLDKATPPRHPKQKYHVEDAAADDEIWYAKWWMLCFPDAAKNMMPKR